MEWSSLLDEASAIINSNSPTRKDMIKLSKIEFNMAVVASKASTLALEAEEQYNLKRSEVVLEEKGRKKSITEATEISETPPSSRRWRPSSPAWPRGKPRSHPNHEPLDTKTQANPHLQCL